MYVQVSLKEAFLGPLSGNVFINNLKPIWFALHEFSAKHIWTTDYGIVSIQMTLKENRAMFRLWDRKTYGPTVWFIYYEHEINNLDRPIKSMPIRHCSESRTCVWLIHRHWGSQLDRYWAPIEEWNKHRHPPLSLASGRRSNVPSEANNSSVERNMEQFCSGLTIYFKSLPAEL